VVDERDDDGHRRGDHSDPQVLDDGDDAIVTTEFTRDRHQPGRTAGHQLLSRRPDDADRRRQLIELTPEGLELLLRDRVQRDAWLHETMRDHLTELEFNLLMLTAPVLRKLVDAAPGAQSVP
jgi:hypothetical protein